MAQPQPPPGRRGEVEVAEQKAQQQEEWGIAECGSEGIVERLGTHKGGRGESVAGLLPLVEAYLGYKALRGLGIASENAPDEIVHGMVDKLELCLADTMWQLCAPWLVPLYPPAVSEREYAQHLAVVEHRDDLNLLVSSAYGLPKRFWQGHVVLLARELVFMLRCVEIPQARPFTVNAQHVLDILIAHLDNLLVLPFCIEYCPSDEYLIRRMPLPCASATQFRDEICRGGVKRTYPPVVQDSYLPHLVGNAAVYLRRLCLWGERQDEEERKGRTHGGTHEAAHSRAA